MVTMSYASPIGELILSTNGKELTGLTFGREDYKQEMFAKEHKKDYDIFWQTIEWLDSYFQGAVPAFMPAIHMEGTTFQKLVWDCLLEIPYGEIATYGDVAKKVAKRMGRENMSAQAVGQALNKNPIAIIVPCHRVLGRGRTLTGYGGGLKRKIALLELEKIAYR